MNDYYLINGRSSIYSVQRACRATSKTMTFATCRLFVDVVVVGGVTTDLKGRGRKKGGRPSFAFTSCQAHKPTTRIQFYEYTTAKAFSSTPFYF